MKILQLSSHSTLRPRHGGQLRSHHIGRCLEDAGFDVARLAICWRTEHDVVDEREPIIDVFLTAYTSSSDYIKKLPFSSYLTDYYSLQAVAISETYRNQVLDYIERVKPDFILLEHPWAWPIVKLSKQVTSGRAKVVYSSQNVEAHLKRRILTEAGIRIYEDVLADIERLERDLTVKSWATIACTNADAEVFRCWGGDQVIVANNGTARRMRSHLRNCLPASFEPQNKYVLAIGSGHPPNVDGFFNLVAPALFRLRPGRRIVISGGMCDAIACDVRGATTINHYGKDRLISLGFIDDVSLDAVIQNASAILLPIEYGGGSNLKTSEALVSGRPVIGTSAAFRGFEDYMQYPLVTIADTSEDFCKAMDGVMTQPTMLSSHQKPVELYWDSMLAKAIALFKPAASRVSEPA